MKSMLEFAREINAVVEGRKVSKVPNKKMAPLTKVEKELQISSATYGKKLLGDLKNDWEKFQKSLERK